MSSKLRLGCIFKKLGKVNGKLESVENLRIKPTNRLRLTVAWRILLSTISCVRFVSSIRQPNGACGNPCFISSLIARLVLPTNALNFSAKSYSGRELPTKSKTVQHSLQIGRASCRERV